MFHKDVLKISRQHGAAPTIGDGCASALLHQVFIILVHADVGSVHNFNNFAVDIARYHPLLFSKLVAGLRRSFGKKVAIGVGPRRTIDKKGFMLKIVPVFRLKAAFFDAKKGSLGEC